VFPIVPVPNRNVLVPLQRFSLQQSLKDSLFGLVLLLVCYCCRLELGKPIVHILESISLECLVL
jgi:hypothetical protein